MQSDVDLVADSSGNLYAAGTAKNHVLVAKVDPSGKILYSCRLAMSKVPLPPYGPG